ncbi:MAG: inner membrane CreD family protein [Planctomycetes bacterium]|nr:inner membrane CreD family protein [Planctomycetota bacterium]
MIIKILSIVFIYLCVATAWVILGATVTLRTNTQDTKLREAVGGLWGTPQHQYAPSVYYQTEKEKKVKVVEEGQTTYKTETEKTTHYVQLEASTINVDLKLDHRKKGLLWYSTYRVKFQGKYRIVNPTGENREIFFYFSFPSQQAVYDNFHIIVGGKELKNANISEGNIIIPLTLSQEKQEEIEVFYESQGLDDWWYNFGENINQIKNFALTMQTDFNQIDFPENSISPTKKERKNNGWELSWRYSNLLSGVQIGMAMPHKLNPGPWASKVTYAAPVSLFLFFFLLFIYATVRQIKLHPMHYFFIGAAFFSFHLLLAYLVDHLPVHLSFLISSTVAIILVVSYMRLVVSKRLAFAGIGTAQLIYLVLFSYTFFFEGYTGLAITIFCVITLFLVMQFTGKVDWDEIFARKQRTS